MRGEVRELGIQTEVLFRGLKTWSSISMAGKEHFIQLLPFFLLIMTAWAGVSYLLGFNTLFLFLGGWTEFYLWMRKAHTKKSSNPSSY